MNPEIHFADKTLLFTGGSAPEGFFSIDLAVGQSVSRTKVLNFLEKHNAVAVLTPEPEAVFARFREEFTWVEAAGGVVENECGEWLMIRRNGRWDLPKGHVEPGESTAECAVREISEETGVAGEIVRPLCRTLHAYWFPPKQRWELKRTHWFRLRCVGAGAVVPQTEEGIEAAVWCSPREAESRRAEMFPTIRRVLDCMKVG